MHRALTTMALLFALSGLLSSIAWAAEPAAVDPDAYYAITYEVSAFEVQTIRPAKVIGVTTIGSAPFLIIDVGDPQKAIGYLELAQVRAILPTHGVFH